MWVIVIKLVNFGVKSNALKALDENQKVNMTSLLVNRDIASVFYLFMMVVGYWGFWIGIFSVWISRIISRYTENDKQQL